MNSKIQFPQYFKSLNTVFYILTGLQILLTFVTIYLVDIRVTAKNEDLDIVFKYSLPILGFGLVMLGIIFYKARLRGIQATDSLSLKFEKFKEAFFIKYGVIEMVVLLSLAACLITHNYQYIIIIALATVIQILSKPSEGNILYALKLNEEERGNISIGNIVAEKEKPLLIRYPVLAVVIISFSLYSCYDVILGIVKREEWSAQEREQMVYDCMQKAKETAIKHPEEVRAYCECTNDAIFRKFTHREIWENNQLPSGELMKTLAPVFAECLNELRARIKEKEKGK